MSDFWIATLSFLIVGAYLGILFSISFYTGMMLVKKLWKHTGEDK